ncbi:hypothetical protein [Spiroplasma endosymbiont of Nebria brevicollis]|uniref:hypothetical protein n=1 Tax=Spiroplasma endosymbiont of Nebria brevicollis TaxID=3066284 RepID=UPI00313EE03D
MILNEEVNAIVTVETPQAAEINISDTEPIINQNTNTKEWPKWVKVGVSLLILATSAAATGAVSFYSFNKYLNELTVETPGSGYNPKTDDKLGSWGAVGIGCGIGFFLASAAYSCALPSIICQSFEFLKDEINLTTPPQSLESSTYGSINNV